MKAAVTMISAAALACVAAPPAWAGDVVVDGWRFNATAYGWATSVSGNVTARGQTVDVNAGFLEIISNASSVAAFNAYFEANKGPAGLYADFVWSNLGASKSASRSRSPVPGLSVNGIANVSLGYMMTVVEVGGLYELARWSRSADSFTALDGLAGFRYWNNSVAANFDASVTADYLGLERSWGLAVARSGTLEWVDPVVGLRLRHQFTPSQTVFVRGDVGGFGLGSLYSWQAVAAYSYAWKFDGYSLAATLGYRALATSYTTGSGIDTRGVDLVLHGPIIGASIRF